MPNAEPSRPRYCDMVMKGGITSGVVYPTAICELARQYQFKSVGGASAGAIAAAAAIAAEFGRKNGVSDSFDQLGRFPQDFLEPNFLPNLFTPTGGTRRIFWIAVKVLKANSFLGKLGAAFFGLLQTFWLFALAGAVAGAIPALLLIFIAGFSDLSVAQTIAVACLAAMWVVVGVFVVTVSKSLFEAIGSVVHNGFGLSNGLDSKTAGDAPLTIWIHSVLNRLAGLPEDRPLVFGDLWLGRVMKDGETADPDSEREMNLEVITTNLNHLSPYKIPFKDDIFYFDPDEWARLFPAPVVSWMIQHAGKTGKVVLARGRSVLQLPEPARLPVVVAARLSLSFPGLVAAVPLYAVDFSLKRNQNEPETLEADRCWFSDGGICSNFPVHFFDSPIPEWPTFAINLKEPHPEHPEMVWLPSGNGTGMLAGVRRFTATSALAGLVEFVAAILSTMKDWRDNLQTRLPGYRNRIVHICLRKEEGGLNLTMPPELIKDLTERGAMAGVALRDEFRWPEHIWARYRTTMCSLEQYLQGLSRAYGYPFPEDLRIREWLTGTSVEATPGYPWKNDEEKAFAAVETLKLATLVEGWEDKGSFCASAPKSKPELRIQPRF